MTHNPYATPDAPVVEATVAETPIYSPTQAACGALLGGPVGLIYFLHANFGTLGQRRQQTTTLVSGIALLLALIAVLPLLPENVPSLPFTLAYVLVARLVAERQQITKQGIIDSPQYGFHSNWRVAGLGLLCCVGSAAAILGPLLGMEMLGLIG